jgi:hypothetical protein
LISGLRTSGKIPVMQAFEAFMYAYADGKGPAWSSGFINGGVCHTFPIDTSERTQVNDHYRSVSVDMSDLRQSYLDARKP